jgi:phenylacetic acid degradation operon negative regulatory protein
MHQQEPADAAATGGPGGPGGPGGEDVPDMPRSRRGGEPQHLLATLLGTYGIGRAEPVPAAMFPRLLAEFGISPAGARNALSRVCRRGLLEAIGAGRSRAYRVTDAARAVQERRRRQFSAFGQPPPPWDGKWTLVMYSVPEDDRTLRQALRTKLTRIGFRAMRDGVWATPRDRQTGAAEVLQLVTPSPAAVLRAELVAASVSFADLDRMFLLGALRSDYEHFVERFAPVRVRVREACVEPPEALVARTRLMDSWREFADADPDLPDELLPGDWPRARAGEVFSELDDALRALALRRLEQLLGPGHFVA